MLLVSKYNWEFKRRTSFRFFRRINYKKGRATAVSATARKLAVIIWNMLVKDVPYQPPTEYLFLDQKRKMKLVSRVKKILLNLTSNLKKLYFY